MSCQGKASASVSACDIPITVKGSVKAYANVKKSDCKMNGTISNACLKIDDVDIHIKQEDVDWEDVTFEIEHFPVTIPKSLLDTVWSLFPFQSLLNQLVGYVEDPVKDAINDLKLCL